MKTKSDQQSDNLSKKILKESGLESPSFDFTHSVMQRVEGSAESNVYLYRPLISLKGWLIVSLLVISVLSVGLIISSEPVAWLKVINKPYQLIWSFSDTFPKISLSEPFLYAAILFGILLYVQIGILRNYFNHRFNFQ